MTFGGEEDTELLVPSAGPNFVDFSPDMARYGQTLVLDFAHRSGHLCVIFSGELHDELANRSAASCRGVVAPSASSFVWHPVNPLEESTGTDHLVETLAQPLVEARKEVSIPVESQSDRRVTEALLDLLRMSPLRNQKRGACVSQVVEPIERAVTLLAFSVSAQTEVWVEARLNERRKVVAAVEVAP